MGVLAERCDSELTRRWCRGSENPGSSLLWWPFLLAALVLVVTSCGTERNSRKLAQNIPDSSTGSGESSTNIVREGDVIQIAFEGSTNLNTTLHVPYDGIIAMPYIGKVKAAGKTIPALETELGALYENQVKATQITVSVVTPAASVSVGGAVFKPGKFPLDRPLTLLDAIIEAGGIDHARAKITDVSVLRVENGTRVPYRINLKRVINGQDHDLLYLRPGDVVYVPIKVFNF